MTGMQRKPFDEINLLGDTQRIVSQYLQLPENEQYQAISNKTKQFLQEFYSSYSLELLSTVDYLIVNTPALQNWHAYDNVQLATILQEEIKKWSLRKEQLFSNNQHLPLVIEHLKHYF